MTNVIGAPRNEAVSICKGIAILLMVMFHAGVQPHEAAVYGSMFRMPVFFVMSGFCFKEKYFLDKVTWVKRKVTGIYWPYLKWGVVFCLLHNVFFSLGIYNDTFSFNGRDPQHLYTLHETAVHLLKMTTLMVSHDQLLGGFWFLRTLFLSGFLFFALVYLTEVVFHSKYARGGGVLFLLLTTYLLLYFHITLPGLGNLYKETLAAIYMAVGFYWKKEAVMWERRWWVIVVALVVVGIGSQLWPSSMLSLTSDVVIPYAICSLVGSLALFGLSYHINVHDNAFRRFLVFTGGVTFKVLTWHFLCFKLVNLLLISLYSLDHTSYLAHFPVIEAYASQGWWILYWVVGAGIPIVYNYFYPRLFPSRS